MSTNTMSFALPEAMRDYVDQRVRCGQYGNTSEYLRELIRQRRREKAAEFLRQLIAEGLASGPATPIEPDYFDKMRERARKRPGK